MLNLENVNTYLGMLVQNYSSNNPTININGGIHCVIFPSTDVGHGFIEGRNNITFTANNATFYLGKSGYGLISSQHYNSTLAESALKSTFTYNNCTIIAENFSDTIIRYANNYTHIYFNGCDIFGSVKPSLGTTDSTSSKYNFAPILPGSIVFGEGTRITKKATFGDAVANADGARFAIIDEITVTAPVRLLTGSVFAGDIAIAGVTNVQYTLNYILETPDEYTVTWYKEDGKTVIKTETVARGEMVTPPAYSVGSVYNGWFKTAGYDGWATTLGGQKVTSFVVNKDLAFYPAPSNTPTAYLVGAQYNLSFLGDIKVNLYIPEAPDGITVNSVTAGGVTVYPTRVILGGAFYDLYEIASVKANKLTTATVVEISYTVEGVALTQRVSLSPLSYATSILSDSTKANPTHPAAAHTMVADMVRYSNELCKLVSYSNNGTATGNSSLESLLSTYGSLCTALPGALTSDSDISALSGYVSSATFDVTTMQPRYVFTFNTSSEFKVVDCYVTMEGYLGENVNGANYGTVTYKAEINEYVSGTEYLSKVYIENIPMYNMANTVTITVLLENGVEKTGTYDIGAYYNGVSISDATQLSILKTVIESLKVFSDSAASYRYADIKVNEENAINFWNCTHDELVAVTLYATNGVLPVSAPAKYCSECGNYFIYYKDFGVVGDGQSNGRNEDGSTNMTGNVTVSGTNEFAAIREAHTIANCIAEDNPFKNIVVVGEGLVGNTFYMGYPDDGGAAAITINTDVDWNGAHFIIDDTTVHNIGETRTAYKQSIFKLVGDPDVTGLNVTANIPNGIAKGATNIGWAPGRPMMLKLTLKSVRHYIRYGSNANDGASQTEMILVDANGNIDPTTPVQWDYTNEDFCKFNITINDDGMPSENHVITRCATVDSNSDGKCDTCGTTITKAFSAVAYSADDKPITVSGLDKNGNINFIWESITSDKVDVSGYDQAQRNINVTRSNVTFQGFDRVFVEDNSAYTGSGSTGTPRQTYAAYINVSNAYNIVIKNMTIDYHLGHDDANGVALGSYEFGGASSINISWIDCVQKDFFRYSSSDGNYIRYGGMFGSNYLRNVYLNGCVLSSYDAHSGLYNATIENSSFDHINLVGGGDAILRNVAVYAEANAGVCHLRSDYGSMWQGDIKLDGVKLRHDDNYSGNLELIKAYYTNHYFGFDTELPENIYINNLSIMQYTRNTEAYTHTNGVVDENETKSSKSAYLYYTLCNSKGSSSFNNDYDYSTVNANNKDPKACTKNVFVTNTSATIIYPDHWFFEDMKVYKDGVEQDWFTVRSKLHSDNNGDKTCDNCGKSLSCSATHPTSGTDNGATCSTCGSNIKKASTTCVAEGTLITLADGSVKPIEKISPEDMILVYNHYTGEYEPSYIVF